MTMRETLTDIFTQAFTQCGYAGEYGGVAVSARPDLCHYQCNGALAAAKTYRQAPMEIAGRVARQVAGDERFASVEAAAPGFINIRLADGFIAGRLNEMRQDVRLGLPQMQPQIIVIDFGGPNVAKPLHVGHLRSAIIGDTLRRLALFLGHSVIGDIHLGDWGLQMGLVIAGIKKRSPELLYFDADYTGEYPNEAPVTADGLNDIYPAAAALAKQDAAFAGEAARATVELQQGRRGYRALWKQVCAVSVADLKKSYDFLNVHFDKWYGESDADACVPRVIQLLRERGLLYTSDGAEVVDVALPEDKEPVPPIIIVKSNGGEVYGTTDLATLYQRVQSWNPDAVWYVVDSRQALHFKQVFRCASRAGIIEERKCLHIGFGTMNGADGKPYKTREGGVMRLSDMIGTITQNARRAAEESAVAMAGAQREETARRVGVAALKIGDLVNHRTKDYIFDMERFMATDGKTGPYLLYTAVRIRSVLAKAGAQGISYGEIGAPASEAERGMMVALLGAGDEVLRAFREKAPNVLCELLFDIAGRLNSFYSSQKILAHQNTRQRALWLALLRLVYELLALLLDILGIEIPEAM